MAWKLLALTTILLSLADCKPAQKMTILGAEPSLTFTPPVQPSTPPKTTLATPILTVAAPSESPLPSASPPQQATVPPPPKHLPTAPVTRSTVVAAQAGPSSTTLRFMAPIPTRADPTNGLALPAGLLCIRHLESTDNYRQPGSPYGDFGGYQYKNGTWNSYAGYARADQAPPDIQDRRALEDYNQGPAVRRQLWPSTSRACRVS